MYPLSGSSVNVNIFVFQACCAIGNCFSLQREHETAIKFFNRAMQVSLKHPVSLSLVAFGGVEEDTVILDYFQTSAVLCSKCVPERRDILEGGHFLYLLLWTLPTRTCLIRCRPMLLW